MLPSHAVNDVCNEFDNASSVHAKFNSMHEGFAVIHEEFDELKAEVWKNPTKDPTRQEKARKEATQLAAMALRFLVDCC